MQQFTLVKHGSPEHAFRLEKATEVQLEANQIAIETEAFGINYADVMATTGRYRDAPPLPSVIGYECVGVVKEIGKDVARLKVGDRVAAFCRFGGYSRQVITEESAAAKIGTMDSGVALALTVQYSTAYYCAEESLTLHQGDRVLIQAAAGGVGIALTQFAKRRGCVVFGTAGSKEKLDFIRSQGVDHPINYRTDDFVSAINQQGGKLDVVFDSLGARDFKRAKKLLAPGGKMVAFGMASRSDAMKNIFGDLKTLGGFGFNSNAFLVMNSHAMIGVNMLQIADHRPQVLTHCMQQVINLYEAGEISPHVGKEFSSDKLTDALNFVATRKSKGKVFVRWN